MNTYATLTSTTKRIETVIELNPTRRVSMVTRKSMNGDVETIVTCGKVDNGFYTVAYGPGGDYVRGVERSQHKRVTNKVVESQHEKHLVTINQYVAIAKAYYEAKDKAAGGGA